MKKFLIITFIFFGSKQIMAQDICCCPLDGLTYIVDSSGIYLDTTLFHYSGTENLKYLNDTNNAKYDSCLHHLIEERTLYIEKGKLFSSHPNRLLFDVIDYQNACSSNDRSLQKRDLDTLQVHYNQGLQTNFYFGHDHLSLSAFLKHQNFEELNFKNMVMITHDFDKNIIREIFLIDEMIRNSKYELAYQHLDSLLTDKKHRIISEYAFCDDGYPEFFIYYHNWIFRKSLEQKRHNFNKLLPEQNEKELESIKFDSIVVTNNFYKNKYFNNGDKIAHARNRKEFNELNQNREPAWCYYNFKSSRKEKIILYNWYALYDSRGLAPFGWHIPTVEEYNNLVSIIKDSDADSLLYFTKGHEMWTDTDEIECVFAYCLDEQKMATFTFQFYFEDPNKSVIRGEESWGRNYDAFPVLLIKN